MPLNDQPSQTALQPFGDASVVITALPRRITTDAAAIAKTTFAMYAHSPVLLTVNVLNVFPDCWPSEVRHSFIVTESKWIPRKFTFC